MELSGADDYSTEMKKGDWKWVQMPLFPAPVRCGRGLCSNRLIDPQFPDEVTRFLLNPFTPELKKYILPTF